MTETTLRATADNDLVITDFATEATDLGWYVLNDDVMGGRSSGGFEVRDGELRFSGSTNTNGGGFSSIRTGPMRLDASASTGIRLRVMGDGRRYTWRLSTDARWRGRTISYWADFDTVAGDWLTVDLPFANFEPIFRGYRLDGPALDTTSIRGMGLMINDETDGQFDLCLSRVEVYP